MFFYYKQDDFDDVEKYKKEMQLRQAYEIEDPRFSRREDFQFDNTMNKKSIQRNIEKDNRMLKPKQGIDLGSIFNNKKLIATLGKGLITVIVILTGLFVIGEESDPTKIHETPQISELNTQDFLELAKKANNFDLSKELDFTDDIDILKEEATELEIEDNAFKVLSKNIQVKEYDDKYYLCPTTLNGDIINDNLCGTFIENQMESPMEFLAAQDRGYLNNTISKPDEYYYYVEGSYYTNKTITTIQDWYQKNAEK